MRWIRGRVRLPYGSLALIFPLGNAVWVRVGEGRGGITARLSDVVRHSVDTLGPNSCSGVAMDSGFPCDACTMIQYQWRRPVVYEW
eukprot:gene11281-biopygen801